MKRWKLALFLGTFPLLALGIGSNSPVQWFGTHARLVNQSGNLLIGTGSTGSDSTVRYLRVNDATSSGVILEGALTRWAIFSSSSGTLGFKDETVTGDPTRLSIAVTSGLVTLHQTAGTDGSGTLAYQEKDTTPASPSDGVAIQQYMKDNKVVYQFNEGGTVRYKYLDMTGTGVTWVHSTTPP